MTIEERLKNLESELAASKTRARRLAYGISILVGAFVVVSTIRPTTEVAYAQSDDPAIIHAKEIRAQRFIVEDEGEPGVEEAIFGMIQDAPGLRLGAVDKPEVFLSNHSGSYLYLADTNGTPRITMQVVGDRSSISLFNEEQKDLLDIALSWDSPSITLTNEKGETVIDLQPAK